MGNLFIMERPIHIIKELMLALQIIASFPGLRLLFGVKKSNMNICQTDFFKCGIGS